MSKNKNKHWIKIFEANSGHYEMLEEFEEVLKDLNIDVYRDDEEEEKGVDLFIRLDKLCP
jgi:hypothetical protein